MYPDARLFYRLLYYMHTYKQKPARFTAKFIFIGAQTTAIQTLNYTK